MNWIIIVALITFVSLFIYVILPKAANSYKIEKAFKIAIYSAGAGYVGYDLWSKEKTGLTIALLIGSIGFIYIIIISRKKE
jgi:ABC-type dipeptide/oligopeptide/nickel transport system permease subunit